MQTSPRVSCLIWGAHPGNLLHGTPERRLGTSDW